MKILLSAYACEPEKGSEPGVGWHWAVELAKLGHEVLVLTRANNKPSIDQALQDGKIPSNLNFLYYDLPGWIRRWKKGNKGVHIYYLLWQRGACRLAQTVHATERFDMVHHVTFVSVRQPSFMGALGIPFIFGPVAGGESAPWRLRFHYGVRGFLLDALRDAANLVVRFDPLLWRTFSRAHTVFVTSEQSKALIPLCFHCKTKVRLAIGLTPEERQSVQRQDAILAGPRILYVGQFLYLKGMGLGLKAFANLAQQFPDARLTMVGKGPDGKKWRRLADDIHIASNIDWVPWVHQSELAAIYQTHDLFLFPSLHDSGGMVVLEAMAHGLPVVCLDLGGPGVLVDDSCGIKIETNNRSEKQVVADLAAALGRLAGDGKLLAQLGRGALQRTAEFTWDKLVAEVYQRIG